jgi:hypothetical protein
VHGHGGNFFGKGMGAKEWFQESEVGLHSLAPIPLPFQLARIFDPYEIEH